MSTRATSNKTTQPESTQAKKAKITKEQVKAIAEQKMPDLNAASLESAMSMVAGTARSMGVVITE
mgnify:CR=1 FL=1